MEKAFAKKIRENKWKEKEEKWVKWVTKLSFVATWVAWKCVEKGVRVEFIIA
jgi:hypothetical protein